MADESLIAVFVDFENLAIGSRDMHDGEFRIDIVLKRLLEKGRIVFKRAYCDWNRYRGAVRGFHAQGIEMIDIPSNRMSGKNSADIRMVVDALDLCYSKNHIDSFVLLTGDSDFSPLVNKLKENNKRVIGCGVKSSTSDLLVNSCDQFLYYDDLVRTADTPRRSTAAPAAPARRGRSSRSGGRGGRGSGRGPMPIAVNGEAEIAAAPIEDLLVPTELEVPATEETIESAPEVVETEETAKPAKPKRAPRGRGRTKKAAAETEAESAPEVVEASDEAPEAKPAKAPRGRARSRAKKKVEPDVEAESAEEAEAAAEVVHDPRAEGLEMLMAIVTSLAQDYDPVWGSLAKQTLRRVHPDFREERYGFTSFVEMLKEAETRNLVSLEYDPARGNYKIRVKS